MIDNLYEDLVTKYSKNYIPVVIPHDDMVLLNDFAERLVKAKESEPHHIVDSNDVKKRFLTGLMGERAVEILLGIKMIEWSVGDSIQFNHPDILGLGVGVKTVERNKFPIIFKKNNYPQIICIRSDKRENLVFVCGVACPNILNRYQSDTLVIRQELVDRQTKTAFYGFEHLAKFENIEELKMAIYC